MPLPPPGRAYHTPKALHSTAIQLWQTVRVPAILAGRLKENSSNLTGKLAGRAYKGPRKRGKHSSRSDSK